ncbi:MAG: hypothetical protein HWE34_09540 [Methylocystaceae bacterium]|nr:hypothetical protein [Methylocystaceae bacterium]
MKTGLSVLAVSAMFMGLSYGANAADLINEDDVPYIVIVNGETEVSVEANAELASFCETCTVQLDGSEEAAIEVGESTAVVISKGKLIVEN